MLCFQSLQCLYEYVFVTAQLDTPFGLFTMCPRRLLNIGQTVCDNNMVLTVEEGDNLIDLVELSVSESCQFTSLACVIRNNVKQYLCNNIRLKSVHFTYLKKLMASQAMFFE